MSSCSFHASKEATGTCTNCGKLLCRACNSEIDGKSYCPLCVEKLFTTSQTAAIAETTPALVAVKTDVQAINPAWWLLPVFLTWAGGLAAWLVNKERNAGMARYMLFGGIGMAFIHGFVGLILIFALLVPSALKPSQKPSAGTHLPPATIQSPAPPSVNPVQKPSTTLGASSAATASTNPTTLISTDQSPDFTAQKSKIDEVIGQLCTAFKAKDVEGALKYFQAEERDKYRKVLSKSPDLLPVMAADLEKAQINFLSSNSNQYSRTAEYLIKSAGQDFSIVFIYIDGQWMLNTF